MAMASRTLRRFGITIRPSEFERLVSEAVEQILTSRRAAHPRHDLSAAESAALVHGGLNLEQADYGTDDPLVQTAAEYSALLAISITVPAVAKMLGVDGSRVRQRLLARTLYRIKLSSGWRIPRFQFDDSRLLPGIEHVIPRLRPGLHPLLVLHWFTLPNPELVQGKNETPISPRDWLHLGLSLDDAANLAAEL